MKRSMVLMFFLFFISVQSQVIDFEKCNVPFSKNSSQLYSVTAVQLKCLGNNSEKQNLVYVYEWWCKPCNEKMNYIKAFAEKHNLNLIVLTLDMEGSDFTKKDEKILKEKFDISLIAVLNDSYGKSLKKKYKNFISEISTKNFNEIGLSEVILYDKSGEIIYLSDIEDNKSDVLTEKVLPLLVKGSF